MIMLAPRMKYRNSEWYIPDSDVRSENLVDTNVCCSEDDLNSDVREASNWSLTKDPKRCDEFEEDGYK